MHKEKNKFKRILWIVLTLLVLTLTGSTLYLQWYALEAGGNERGKDLETSYAFMYEHYPFLSHWVDSLQRENALRDTFILAEDGARLHALYLYADTLTAHTAVAVHGYTDNAVRMLHIAYLYNHDLHYNVLLPDLRFAGQSEGDHIQMGWKDRLDVLRWMEVANELFAPEGSQTRMVVHGISMGAATTVCVSGEPQPPFVNCFVEDCGYTSVWDEYAGELKNQFGLPALSLAPSGQLGYTPALRLGFPGSLATGASKKMPASHVVHSRYGRHVRTDLDGRQPVCRQNGHQRVVARRRRDTCRFLSKIC